MSEHKLCEACRKLLSGGPKPKVDLYHDETHHIDAGSFRKALQLPCYLCCFILAKPSQATISDINVTDGTKYSESDFSHEGVQLWFQIHPEGAFPLRMVKWESMLNDEISVLPRHDG
jgi:hypothetical protein